MSSEFWPNLRNAIIALINATFGASFGIAFTEDRHTFTVRLLAPNGAELCQATVGRTLAAQFGDETVALAAYANALLIDLREAFNDRTRPKPPGLNFPPRPPSFDLTDGLPSLMFRRPWPLKPYGLDSPPPLDINMSDADLESSAGLTGSHSYSVRPPTPPEADDGWDMITRDMVDNTAAIMRDYYRRMFNSTVTPPEGKVPPVEPPPPDPDDLMFSGDPDGLWIVLDNDLVLFKEQPAFIVTTNLSGEAISALLAGVEGVIEIMLNSLNPRHRMIILDRDDLDWPALARRVYEAIKEAINVENLLRDFADSDFDLS